MIKSLGQSRTYLPSLYDEPHNKSFRLGVIGDTSDWNDPMMYRYYTFSSIGEIARKIESTLKKHIKFELVCLSDKNDTMDAFSDLSDTRLNEFFVGTVSHNENAIDTVDCLIRVGGDESVIHAVDKFKKDHPDRFVVERDEAHHLDGNLYVKSGNFERPFIIGVTGFSDESKISNVDAYKKNIEFSIGSIKYIVEIRNGKVPSFVFVGGLTYSGVNRFMYDYVSKLPDTSKTVGIACAKAKDYPQFPVDETHIIGNEWGEESDFFLKYIDCLIAFPGGKQSQDEAKKFQDIYPDKQFFNIAYNLFE